MCRFSGFMPSRASLMTLIPRSFARQLRSAPHSASSTNVYSSRRRHFSSMSASSRSQSATGTSPLTVVSSTSGAISGPCSTANFTASGLSKPRKRASTKRKGASESLAAIADWMAARAAAVTSHASSRPSEPSASFAKRSTGKHSESDSPGFLCATRSVCADSRFDKTARGDSSPSDSDPRPNGVGKSSSSLSSMLSNLE
mmetsp:Transcript_11262/g.31244  ORF Transcript_11262/g.31244 Transcript_11262/m.31244 type:complete len:200 (+) Transcript_11262:1438-2037(+)